MSVETSGLSPASGSSQSGVADAGGIFGEIIDAFTSIPDKVAKATVPKDYRGWSISWDYGYFTATGPDYDASWEGEEDGWVDNGHIVSARTIEDLREEVDAWIEERASTSPVPHD
jgi:hypothetical protein